MKRRSLLARTLSIILFTILLSAALTALAFRYSGAQVFSRLKAQELSPRAKFVADITADYLEGDMSSSVYKRTIGSEYRIWDAFLYVFDANQTLFVYPANDNQEHRKVLEAYVDTVLSGDRVASTMIKNRGVVLGEPVRDRAGRVIGAVFFIKPIGELKTAFNGLSVALVISMLAVAAIMAVPTYLLSRSLVDPLRQMTEVASSMARGDFSARAQTEGALEIARLGEALNHLSGELSQSISALTFERNRLQAVLFGLGEGIVAVNAAGKIMQYNPAAKRLLDGGEEPDLSLLPAYGRIRPQIEAVLADKASRTREIKHKNVTLRFTLTALLEEEQVMGAVMLIQDVTEAARLEQTRRDYVANVSHELRTPIASIRSLADALNDGLIKKDEDRLRYYGYIVKESLRMSRLIDDLLELSRLQSGTVAITKSKFDVEELVREVADRYQTAASKRDSGIVLEVPELSGKAWGNPDRAEQALIALIDNAIKHSAPGSEIRVRVLEEETRFMVQVSNPGDIGEEDLEHLFDRFYKVDKSHSGNGTGLGLSIAREVMSLMGERIWAACREGRVDMTFTLGKFKADM